MFKNIASQKIIIYAHDVIANIPKLSDAGQITLKVSKDAGALNALGDVSATELAEGMYWFDLTQAETNADILVFTGVSTTPGIQIITQIIHTTPPSFNAGALAVSSIQNTIAVDVAGLDGNAMVGTNSALLAASAPTNFGDLSITVTTGRVDIESIEGNDATDVLESSVATAGVPRME